MNKTIKILIIVVLVTTTAFLTNVTLNTKAVGVSPRSIEMYNLTRNQNYMRMFKVWNSNQNDGTIALDVTGEAAGWITLYLSSDTNKITPINTVWVLGRSWSEQILVDVNIPNDVATGSYTAQVNTYDADATEVVVVAPVIITIEVTGEENLDGIVKSILIKNVEIGDLLGMSIEFENTGNVIAKPEIEINILKNNIPVTNGNIVYANTSVSTNKREIISIQWDTSGREPGNYTANITVKLKEKIISQQTKDFKLLQFGELSTEIELTQISYEGTLSPDNVLTVYAEVKNTGKVNTYAKFMADIYLNGVLVDNITSEESLTRAQQNTTLVAYLNITDAGDYAIKGYVSYGGRITPTTDVTPIKEISFHVADIIETTLPTLAVIGALAGAGVIVYLKRDKILKMRGSRKNTVENISKRTKNKVKIERKGTKIKGKERTKILQFLGEYTKK
ncbi:hypothetical protein MBGDN05_00729 [Thermoplasmatales archaeon SCGC AB-539-N05]|nr:hypothetical protein MBGDN05_00729 [Thermoplasmatales archaeon SCGC AB-539-N05]